MKIPVTTTDFFPDDVANSYHVVVHAGERHVLSAKSIALFPVTCSEADLTVP